jgi:general secretion pathway protein D
VSLNFDDADVYTVIQTIFADVLRVDYVVDPRVKGRVTFRSISPVSTDKVLPLMEVILRQNGIGIVEEGGLYRIVPIGEVSKEPSPVGFGRDPAQIPSAGKSILQVIPILHVTSTEIVRLISPFVSGNAVIVDVPKSNQVIVVDTDANVRRIVQLIILFDDEKKKPHVNVIPVQNGKAADVAALLQQIFLGAKAAPLRSPATSPGQPMTSRPAAPGQPAAASSAAPQVSMVTQSGDPLVSDSTRIFADEVANSIIVLATPQDFAIIKEAIAKIDTVPRQVIIEGVIALVTLTDNLSVGMGGLLKSTIGSLNATWALNAPNLVANPANLGFSFVGTDQNGAVRAVITALATQSKAKVMAAPHILVSDNREARIQVGQQVPIVTSETIASAGVPAQRTVQYRDIGIILKVKPRVNEGGLVAMDIAQEVSTYSTIKLYVDSTEIILNKTEATTNLVVQDGQTIVIGGLIREDTSRTRTGLPFLTKIPWLGWLFGDTDDDESRQEIIILLTPHVLKTAEAAREMTSEMVDRYSTTGKGQVPKGDLMRSLIPAKPAPPGEELPR